MSQWKVAEMMIIITILIVCILHTLFKVLLMYQFIKFSQQLLR